LADLVFLIEINNLINDYFCMLLSPIGGEALFSGCLAVISIWHYVISLYLLEVFQWNLAHVYKYVHECFNGRGIHFDGHIYHHSHGMHVQRHNISNTL